MSDVNLIKNKIREELEKEYHSKKKILSFLLDRQLLDELKSLPDSQLFVLIGDLFKLNPMFFTEQLYKDIKKKIGKLYGDEEVKSMEEYLINNYGLFGPEYILDIIKEAYNPTDPSKDINWKLRIKSKVSAIFSNLLSKKEFQHLTISDLNTIVDGTFKLDSQFFTDSIFLDFRRRLRKNDRLAMDKYFIEKYSLIEGEHIIHKCTANLTYKDLEWVGSSGGFGPNIITGTNVLPVKVSSSYGSVFITNYRIITQGNFDIKGGRNPSWGLTVHLLSGKSRKYRTQKRILNAAPVYGYHFPRKNHLELRKWQNYVTYACIKDNQFKLVEIHLTSETPQEERDKEIHIIYKILSENLDQIKETIKVLLEMNLKDFYKKRQLILFLRNLRSSEVDHQITDSEYLDIIKTTYKINPQFFMNKVYPKLLSTKKPFIQPIKNDLIELIEHLSKETI